MEILFTPTPDATQGSQMVLTYFDENTQTENQRKYRKARIGGPQIYQSAQAGCFLSRD